MKNYPALLSRPTPAPVRRGSAAKAIDAAFSLVEVVMAVGVLGVTVVALLGLFGPTMTAVNHVVDRSGAQGAATRFNSALVDNEIYHKVLGRTMTADLTDSDLESIEDALGAYVDSAATNPSSNRVLPFFAWKEFGSTSDAESRDLNKMEFQLAGINGTPAMPTLTSDFLQTLEGGIYLILVSEPAPSVMPSSGGMVENLGYLPIKVAVFDYDFMPGDNLATDAGSANNTNGKINQYATLKKGKPLVEYTTVISRP